MGFAIRSFDPSAAVSFALPWISEDIDKPITLLLRHAGNGNPGYISATLKQRGSPGVGAMQMIQEDREVDVGVFAEHVIVGWENVADDGAPCPFSAKSCARFLRELIMPPPDGRPDVFDRVRSFARNADNFRAALARPADVGKG